MEKSRTFKEFREQVLGMTMHELAAELGMSYSSVWRLDRRGSADQETSERTDDPRGTKVLWLALERLAHIKGLSTSTGRIRVAFPKTIWGGLFLVADSARFFTDRNLSIEIQTVEADTDALNMLSRGETDIALAAHGAWDRYTRVGMAEDLGVIMRAPYTKAVHALSVREVRSLEELGERSASFPRGSDLAVPINWIRNTYSPSTTGKLLSVGTEEVAQRFREDESMIYFAWEPLVSQIESRCKDAGLAISRSRAFRAESRMQPMIYYHLIASSRTIKDNPESIVALSKALVSSEKLFRENRGVAFTHLKQWAERSGMNITESFADEMNDYHFEFWPKCGVILSL